MHSSVGFEFDFVASPSLKPHQNIIDINNSSTLLNTPMALASFSDGILGKDVHDVCNASITNGSENIHSRPIIVKRGFVEEILPEHDTALIIEVESDHEENAVSIDGTPSHHSPVSIASGSVISTSELLIDPKTGMQPLTILLAQVFVLFVCFLSFPNSGIQHIPEGSHISSESIVEPPGAGPRLSYGMMTHTHWTMLFIDPFIFDGYSSDWPSDPRHDEPQPILVTSADTGSVSSTR